MQPNRKARRVDPTGLVDRLGSSVDADLADRVGGADRGGKVDFVDFVSDAGLSDCKILAYGLDSSVCVK